MVFRAGLIGAGVGLSAFAVAAGAQTTGDVKAGVDAWQAGDYQAAVAQWTGPAAAGDPDASFNLGQAYRYGRGVPQDLGKAMQLFGNAAAKGHTQAEASLGLLMFQTGDHAGAVPHLQRAAEGGDPRAQYYLGTALFNGDGVPIDQVRAYALMTRAAAAGLPPATNSLRQMDEYLPTATRQKGTALARKMETRQPQFAGTPRPAGQSVPLRTPPARSVSPVSGPAPIARTDLPPSAAVAGATYALPSAPPAPTATPRPVAARPAPSKPPAPVATSGTGGWRVQLGAFGSPEKAKQLWDGLHTRYAGLAGAQPYLVRAGTITRLQAGPIASKGAADAICQQAKAAGQDCIAVRP